jgi:hypothetical protein
LSGNGNNNGKPIAAPEIARNVDLTGRERIFLLRALDGFLPGSLGMHRRCDEIYEHLVGLWDWDEVNVKGISAAEEKAKMPFELKRAHIELIVSIVDQTMGVAGLPYALGKALRGIQARMKQLLDQKEEAPIAQA